MPSSAQVSVPTGTWTVDPAHSSRGDWDMTFNQALASGNMLVSDKVTITLDVSAIKQS